VKINKSNQTNKNEFITIVSGLPRSGTSMMMRMLQAGGIDVLTDNIRTPNEDNPLGYFEIENVKKLKDGEYGWLSDAEGKAIKVISALLENLPDQYKYKVIFMRRDIDEVLASQKQMLVRRNEPVNNINDDELGQVFKKHLFQVEHWLAEQRNFEVVYVDYKDVINNTKSNLMKLRQNLDIKLDIESMLSVPDQGLYRQRKTKQ
jgi:hypothetical protein